MKIILKHPSETVPGNHDSSVFTEVIPESMDARRLAEQFCRLGRQRKGCFLIRLDIDSAAFYRLKAEEQRQMVRLLVRSMYQGAYRFRKEGLKELQKGDVFGMRESLADFGSAVFYLESSAAEDSGFIRAVRYGELEEMYCLCQKPWQSSGQLPGSGGIFCLYGKACRKTGSNVQDIRWHGIKKTVIRRNPGSEPGQCP